MNLKRYCILISHITGKEYKIFKILQEGVLIKNTNNLNGYISNSVIKAYYDVRESTLSEILNEL